MNEIDDLLGTSNNNNYKKQNSKNNWKEQNKKRNDAYRKMDEMSFKITKDGDMFKQYLNILNRFEKYSVGNCLLILETEPNAIQIKEKKDWIDKGYDTIENAKSMTILEPNKVDGKVYYNPKDEYDISQTNAPIPKGKTYTNKEMLLAIFSICDKENITREVVNILPSGNKGAEYIESENKLYMCRGLNPEYLIKTVIQEIARIEMKNFENSEMKEFKTYCISYMLCKKYGLDISKFDFSNLPKDLINKAKGKEIREELDDIRTNFIEINSKVAEYFEKEEKSKKNKEQAR